MTGAISGIFEYGGIIRRTEDAQETGLPEAKGIPSMRVKGDRSQGNSSSLVLRATYPDGDKSEGSRKDLWKKTLLRK